MNEINLSLHFKQFDTINELPKAIQALMHKAIKARESAYAPYSNFLVGAAILLDNGEIVIGSNQENAAYPSGLCAERVAIFSAGALYPQHQIEAICITAGPKDANNFDPIAPCGACRQSLLEYEVKQQKNIPIYFMGINASIVQTMAIKDLLPFVFERNHLQ